MKSASAVLFSAVCCAIVVLSTQQDKFPHERKTRCQIPSNPPKNLEHVIGECQDQIKLSIISALQTLDGVKLVDIQHNRSKRDTFSSDEKRIAGCLLQCVYQRMNALNEVGFPRMESLVKLYSENVTDMEYLIATYQAVHTCVTAARKQYLISAEPLQDGQSCDIAYEMFDCVSEKIGEYCGQTP